MEAFFGEHDHAPLVGSVKSNFGHLLTAAGMASLLKATLALSRGSIPPTIRVEEPLASSRGAIGGAGVVRDPRPWPDGVGRPRRAGVNAFGFGGTNAHLVLEEPGGSTARPAPGGGARRRSRSSAWPPASGRSPTSRRSTGTVRGPFRCPAAARGAVERR